MKKHISVLLALVMLFSLASALPAMAKEETLLEQWVNGDSESAVMARFWFPDAGAGYDADGDGRGDYIDQVESMILDMCRAGFGGCEFTMLLDSTDFGVLSQEQYDALGFEDAEDAISKLGWGTASWANIIACAADTANRYNRENGTDFHVDVTITAHWPMIINNVAPNDPEQQQQLVYTVQPVTEDMLQNGATLELPTMKTEDEANSAAMTSTYIFTDTLVASTLVRASDGAEQSASGETTSASGEASGEASAVSYDFSSLTDMTASVEAREGYSAGVPEAGARYMRLEDSEWVFYETASEIDPSYADADDYIVLQKGTEKVYEPEHELSVAVTINFVTSYTVTDKTTGEVVDSGEYDLVEKGSVVSYYSDDDGDLCCMTVEVPELLTIGNRHFFGERDEMADRQMLYSISGEALRDAGAAAGEYYLINTYRRGTGQVASGGGNIPMTNKTYAVDYFSSAGAQKVIDYWEENLLPHEYLRADGTSDTLRDILEENGATIFEDSIELSHTDGILWTANMLEELAVIGGVEDAAKYMPVFAGLRFDSSTDADGLQTRLSQALKITMNELYCREHLGTVGEWTETFNYRFRTQCHGIDAVDSGAAAFAAGIAESDNATDGFGTRAYAGAKNVNPDNNVISNESLTFGTGFGEFPSWYYAENTLNRYYSEGVNRVIYHGTPFKQRYTKTSTADSSWPGWDFMSFMAWNSRQTWWDDVDVFTGYTNRVQAILQNGDSKIPVAVLENAASSSVTGLNRGVGLSKSTMQELIGQGYNYSILTKGVLEAESAVSADGSIYSDGPAYRAVVISESELAALGAENREKILAWAAEGLPVFVLGEQVPDGCIAVSDKGEALLAALDEAGVYAAAAYEAPSLVAQHYRDETDSAEYYLLYNDYNSSGNENMLNAGIGQSLKAGEAIETSVTLQGSGVPVELDAVTGDILRLTEYEDNGDGTVTLPVALKSRETMIIGLVDKETAQRYATVDAAVYGGESGRAALELGEDWALTIYSKGPDYGEDNVQGAVTSLEDGLTRTIYYDPAASLWTELDMGSVSLADGVWSALEAPAALNEDNFHSAKDSLTMTDVSGVGVYTKTVTIDDWDGSEAAVLELSHRQDEIVEVRVNGVSLGVFDNVTDCIDLSAGLREGENEITVVLATTLLNRALAENEAFDGTQKHPGTQAGAQEYGLSGACIRFYSVEN